MDLAQAQARLGIPGRLHEVHVVAAEGTSIGELRDRLALRLGDAVRVVTPEAREREASRILSAFRLNLTALSLISVVVGGFLIFAAVRDSLLRRRGEFGLLRALGATREQVLGLVLGEAILLGLVGTVVGIPLGRLAAEANLSRVGQTLSTIYLIDAMHAVVVDPLTYVIAFGVGLGGALVAAVGPAMEVSRREARRLLSAFTLDEASARTIRGRLVAALLLVVGGVIALLLGITAWRGTGFAIALGTMAVLTLVAPALVRSVARITPVRGFGVGFSLRNLSLRISSTSVAVAALAVATSMLVGVTVMVGSFRETLVVWLDQTLEADVYVSSASWTRAAEAAVLDQATLDRLRALPGVRGMDTLRQLQVRAAGRPILLGGVEGDVGLTDRRIRLLQGTTADMLAVFEPRARSVIVSEPLYRKSGLGRGDSLSVSTPGGTVRLPIRGVYADYASEGGAAFVSRETLDHLFGPGLPQNAALFVPEGTDPERLVDVILRELSDLPITAHSNRRLRAESLEVFDETFRVTRLLQLMALLVAATGIALTLVVLARERLSELALFRALGATRGQVFRVFVGEGLGMGALGLLLGAAGGAILALDLVFVVNRAYFGWTLQLHWPVLDLLVQAAIVIATSILAAVYPAFLASRTSAAELAREDV
jgi:putative ABC transport system permease protein